ncbi:hypothetical protein BGX29_007268 [Mortierella sp. GBA35]|nr:hypothetical protein BGX29_007268 [Mortierella sp. GBA35]
MENFEPRDTDMASPPSSLQSQSLPYSQPSSQSSSTATAPAAPAPAALRTKAGQRRTVNDGYIYHPYEEYAQSDRNTQGSDGDNGVYDSQTSATRILELRGLERRIIQLLETAGQAIQILSGEDDAEDAGAKLMGTDDAQGMIDEHAEAKSEQFSFLAAGYATLVNEIQSGLRRQFHYLTKAGIASSQVPFKNVVYGEEKELETWLNAVDVLKESTDGLIEKVERELLGVKAESESASAPAPHVALTAAGAAPTVDV